MLTQEQIKDLKKYFQIDEFTILREYFQVIFLNYLYKERKADQIYFKGGTAIRLLLNSPRFSEDLDFSITISRPEIKKLLEKMQKSIQKEFSTFKILPLYSGKKSVRYRIKYQIKDFKYPIVIRLDFAEKPKPLTNKNSPLMTKFPIPTSPVIKHLSSEEILAEKICALLSRAKGRDVFDTWFLLEKDIPFNIQLINKKNKKFRKTKLIKKVNSFSQEKLKLDLAKFLPQTYRKIIPELSQKLSNKLAQY